MIMQNYTQSTWSDRYLQLAKHISTWSKDPSRKVGAVAVGSKGQILSQGFNGFPRGIFDADERLNDREVKYRYVVHAEMNVIYNASFSGVSLNDADLYVYGLPVCSECVKGIIQVGIKSVNILTPLDIPTKWLSSWEDMTKMLEECNITSTFTYE